MGNSNTKNGDHGGKSVLQAKPPSGRRLGRSEAQALLCLHSAPTSDEPNRGFSSQPCHLFCWHKKRRSRGLLQPPEPLNQGHWSATSIGATPHRGDCLFRLISPQAKHPPQAVACGSSLDPLWRYSKLKNKQHAPDAFDNARRAPGQKKRLGISEKTSELVFREISSLFPVRLRTGGPAKPACPGAACFHFLCYCGALLDKKVMQHPQWMGSGEDHPPRRGLGQRPSVPPLRPTRTSRTDTRPARPPW